MDPAHAVPFDYASVTPGDVQAGIDSAIVRAESLVGEIAAVPDAARSVENTLHPVDEISDLLMQAGGRYGFLSQVSPDPALRETAHAAEEKLDTFATGLGFREELDAALRALDGVSQDRATEPEASRYLDFGLRDFRRNGMSLDAARRSRLRDLKERLVQLGIAFRRNIDEYEDAIVVSRAQLDGLPDAYIDGLATEQRDGETRYRVSLDYPDLVPFMENAHDGALREELFRKNHNKAAQANLPLLEEAIGLRAEIASILGYASWADYQTEIRVARSPEIVLEFLADLEARVRPKAAADMARLRAIAGADFAIWDWRYLTQRLLREEYQVDAFEVAEYFPLDAVLDGLFRVYEGSPACASCPTPAPAPGTPTCASSTSRTRTSMIRPGAPWWGTSTWTCIPAPASSGTRPRSRCRAGGRSPPARDTRRPSAPSSRTSPNRRRTRPRSCSTPRS